MLTKLSHSTRFRKWLPTFSTFLMILLVGIIFVAALRPSDPQNVDFSNARLIFLGVTGLVISYFIASIFSSALLRLNPFVLYLTICLILLLEVVVRAFPTLVPLEFLRNLPPEDRRQLAENYGLATFNSRMGNGMLYHYKPFEKVKKHPYIKIDGRGFRNPSESEKKNFDVVLLGDSMIFSKDVPRDLGELLRKDGYSTLNFGMPGFAPQQYRDAYKKFVIKAGIKSRYTLIFLFIGNDFHEAVKYEKAWNKTGDWKGYVEIIPKNYFQEYLPWVLNIFLGIPEYISGKIENPRRLIELPYRPVKIGFMWGPPGVTEKSYEWGLVQRAIDDIIHLSRTNGSIPLLFLIPSPATIYSQFRDDLNVWDDNYRETAKTLNNYSMSQDVKFINLNNIFRQKIKKEFIFAHDWNCHFNQSGVEQLFNVVLKVLSEQEVEDLT